MADFNGKIITIAIGISAVILVQTRFLPSISFFGVIWLQVVEEPGEFWAVHLPLVGGYLLNCSSHKTITGFIGTGQVGAARKPIVGRKTTIFEPIFAPFVLVSRTGALFTVWCSSVGVVMVDIILASVGGGGGITITSTGGLPLVIGGLGNRFVPGNEDVLGPEFEWMVQIIQIVAFQILLFNSIFGQIFKTKFYSILWFSVH